MMCLHINANLILTTQNENCLLNMMNLTSFDGGASLEASIQEMPTVKEGKQAQVNTQI